jgi:transposase
MVARPGFVSGMANRYKVTLTGAERAQLTELTRSGKATAAKFIHARALLLCDAGEWGDPWKVAEVAAALGVSARTVEHLKQRFVEEGLDAALARKPPRQPRAVTFDGEFDARLTALACSQAPAGYRRWTVRLLADRLVELKLVASVSTMTVQRSLKKTSCSLT